MARSTSDDREKTSARATARRDAGGDRPRMQRALVTIGSILLAAGLAWPLIAKIGLGRLPGDIAIRRPSVQFYFPIATCVLLSLLASFVAWLLRR